MPGRTVFETCMPILGIAILLSIASDALAEIPLMKTKAMSQEKISLQNELSSSYTAPELEGIEGWLNGGPHSLQNLRGKVVLVNFWTYSCYNCVNTLPYVTAWDRKYRGQGLTILGVHAPEYESDKKRANIEAALLKHDIKYPVAIDNKLDTWTAFQNRYWPAFYLIDKQGRVVYTHFGEGDYAITENNIRALLSR